MKFEIDFTPTAANHIRSYRKFEQMIILDAIESLCENEPIIPCLFNDDTVSHFAVIPPGVQTPG